MQHKLNILAMLAGTLLAAVVFIFPRFTPRSISQPSIIERGTAEEEENEYPSDWFLRQRVWPGTSLNTPAVEQARQQAAQMRSHGHSLDEPWTFAGPSNVGGRITALAASSSAPNIVYAGAALGGVYKSTDGGLNFTSVFQQDYALSTGALAMDPGNPQRLWLGTGEANSSGDSYGGNGVYLTTDGGTSWQHKGLDSTYSIGRIAIDPTDPNRVFVAAAGELFGTNPQRGLYRTTDGGTTWQRVLFLTDSTACIDVALNPQRPDTVFAVMWERIRRPWQRQAGGVTSGIWRSYDGGTTWSHLTTGLPSGSTVGRGALVIAPSNPSRMYAVFANHPGNLIGLYKSTDGGTSWAQVASPSGTFYSSFGWYFGSLAVHPTNPDIVYAQGVYSFRSTNAGASWNYAFSDAHPDHHAIWINSANPAQVISGHDGGVNMSTNSGSTSTPFVSLPVTQFYAITSDHLLPQRLYGGTQDNSTPRTLTGATNDWDVLYGGDGFYCAVDPRNSNTIYAEAQYGDIARSSDGGNSWAYISSAFGSDRTNWSTPFLIDPNNPNVLYFGTYRMWRTTNMGDTWTAISGDLSSGPGNGNLIYGTITTLDVSPVDSNVIYAGTDDAHVWRTTNRGTNWTDISAALPNRWCTRVTAHPDSASVVFAAFSGYKEIDYLPHLLRSSDFGSTWTDIGAGLPEAPVNDILVDPLNSALLYAGTDFGVFFSSDYGLHWSTLGEGLPMSPTLDLELTTARDLVAGTHGISMWKYALGTGQAPAVPAALAISISNSNATLNWMASAGAASYHIFGSSTPGTPGTLLATVTATTWTDPDFAARPATFFYYVTAE